MHELPITQSILEIVLKTAQKSGAQRVTRIDLVIGKLSSAVDDSIQFYWDIIAEGTIAQGARLHFERVPTEMKCIDCGNEFQPTEETFECPKCMSPRVHINRGDELRVESIDIE